MLTTKIVKTFSTTPVIGRKETQKSVTDMSYSHYKKPEYDLS